MVDVAGSRYVSHTTADPDAVVVDTALVDDEPMPLMQVFRFRDGEIFLLRDYFALDAVR